MATLIPALSVCPKRMNSGEKKVAEILESKLEADYWLWYDVPVGDRGFHPDFIVLNARRGVLVLEVKDWKPSTLRSVDKYQVTLEINGRSVKDSNPLEQARVYACAIANRLQQDQQLVHPASHAKAGKLVTPWGYGAIFTRMTRAQLYADPQVELVLPPDRVLCADDLGAELDSEGFQAKLWAMFSHFSATPLTLPQVDRIRWHLFPEIRIPIQQDLFEDKSVSGQTALPDLMKVMDIQQEQLARSLGSGHRIIHGVAGSGKTMILSYRAEHLAKMGLAKPVLLLCFNKPLAHRLRQFVRQRQITDRVTVQNFHAWCAEQLRTYHVDSPDVGQKQYFDSLVETIIQAVDQNQIPREQYSAILIDEGHDFEPAWFKLIVQMLDKNDDNLLLLYDDAQSIYHRASKRFSWKSIGIQAQGRTTILRMNYRNTNEVLDLAKRFAQDILTPNEADDDGIPRLSPLSAGRSGMRPTLIRFPAWVRETDYLVQRVTDALSKGNKPSHIAILARYNNQLATFKTALDQAGIPVIDKNKGEPQHEGVSLLTYHSAKGLEFPLVFMPGLGYQKPSECTEQDEAQLLYVAMTRSTDELAMTYTQESSFTKRLEALLHGSPSAAEPVPVTSST
ncbi:hypothetical protein HNQ59_001211 [Chitinivorax tropicus]|uniref:DNA 3'-5' helicase II n=1 Tax=Chitinivorax tropicus TaxID=714531 RepID=A0A840MN45_9PROT|nr:3'-5' exonuclease [Chitinivorax tropicus]MBB5017926.1 hypothetical protein [Chitinivorax tropicus]